MKPVQIIVHEATDLYQVNCTSVSLSVFFNINNAEFCKYKCNQSNARPNDIAGRV